MVLVFRCRNNTCSACLSNDLQWTTDDDARRRPVCLITRVHCPLFPSYNDHLSNTLDPYWRHLCIISGTFQETSKNPSIPAIVRITFTNL